MLNPVFTQYPILKSFPCNPLIILQSSLIIDFIIPVGSLLQSTLTWTNQIAPHATPPTSIEGSGNNNHIVIFTLHKYVCDVQVRVNCRNFVGGWIFLVFFSVLCGCDVFVSDYHNVVTEWVGFNSLSICTSTTRFPSIWTFYLLFLLCVLGAICDTYIHDRK